MFDWTMIQQRVSEPRWAEEGVCPGEMTSKTSRHITPLFTAIADLSFGIFMAHCGGYCTVYPKKYAHGFCFAVLCCGYTWTDFPISIRLTSLARWQSNDCPSASKATLMNMDKYFMWIHYERLHNHNKAKHNKTVCIFLGIKMFVAVTYVVHYVCCVSIYQTHEWIPNSIAFDNYCCQQVSLPFSSSEFVTKQLNRLRHSSIYILVEARSVHHKRRWHPNLAHCMIYT